MFESQYREVRMCFYYKEMQLNYMYNMFLYWICAYIYVFKGILEKKDDQFFRSFSIVRVPPTILGWKITRHGIKIISQKSKCMEI